MYISFLANFYPNILGKNPSQQTNKKTKKSGILGHFKVQTGHNYKLKFCQSSFFP
jgi:hypothetical protein